MLPTLSHATPAVRTKLSPGIPDPGGPAGPRPPPPPAGGCPAAGVPPRPASAGASPCRRPDRDCFRLAAQHQQDAAVLIELDDVARPLIDDPDVVLRIDLD